jgi:hypothetical protein
VISVPDRKRRKRKMSEEPEENKEEEEKYPEEVPMIRKKMEMKFK